MVARKDSKELVKPSLKSKASVDNTKAKAKPQKASDVSVKQQAKQEPISKQNSTKQVKAESKQVKSQEQKTATGKQQVKKEQKATVKKSTQNTKAQVDSVDKKAVKGKKDAQTKQQTDGVDQPLDKVQRVRVWWPPTSDKKKTSLSGMYWPAKILDVDDLKSGTRLFRVEYDNGETEVVRENEIFPFTVPVDFGKEQVPFVAGEFVEISNDSDSDPAEWLGMIYEVNGQNYKVVYPFHDSQPEDMSANLLRRATVYSNDTKQTAWVKPAQDWGPGEVVSPLELETCSKEELFAQIQKFKGDSEHGKMVKQLKNIQPAQKATKQSQQKASESKPKQKTQSKVKNNDKESPTASSGAKRAQKTSSDDKPKVKKIKICETNVKQTKSSTITIPAKIGDLVIPQPKANSTVTIWVNSMAYVLNVVSKEEYQEYMGKEQDSK